MSTRKWLVAAVFVGAVAPLPALAGDGFAFVGGEAGYPLIDVPKSGLTRAQKRTQDQAQASAEAAQLSGWRRVDGEPGWIYEGHKYARVDGTFACIDGIDHTTRASFEPLRDASLFRGA